MHMQATFYGTHGYRTEVFFFATEIFRQDNQQLISVRSPSRTSLHNRKRYVASPLITLLKPFPKEWASCWAKIIVRDRAELWSSWLKQKEHACITSMISPYVETEGWRPCCFNCCKTQNAPSHCFLWTQAFRTCIMRNFKI